jgi:hypothetical protein
MEGRSAMRTLAIRAAVVLLRRLTWPAAAFVVFNLLCVLVYMQLERLRWIDALFWIVHPHSIDYRSVRDATKLFAGFVFLGVFSFQIWIAERVLGVIFRRQGLEAWRFIMNEATID